MDGWLRRPLSRLRVMTECLDEEAILSFCRGSMALARRPSVEAHLAECDECRALVSAVVRSSIVEPKEVVADPAMAPTTPAQGGFGSSVERAPQPVPALPLASPVRPGDVLAGKYLVERVLGAGGMGVVVAARHTQLEQRVALKFLLPAACEAPGAIARFLREGKAAARITSEHVARVVDTGVLEGGAPYLVMEYLDGSDLGALVAKRGPLHFAQAIEYVLQACEAIVEAHQLGIVHRDLKPANLFLSQRKDGSPLVKVLDFGISKADGGSQTQLTSTSMLMGSPRYMSPEQMVSAKDVDARTDVWALGVILYELVTGRPVWQADTVQGLCALIATAPAPPLRMHAPLAPELLEHVVSRCLVKDPEQRLASVADLALALAPVAPPTAQTSIERILRVAGRAPSAAPLPAVASPFGFTAQAVPAGTSVQEGSSGGRFALLLAVGIGALIAAGIALNAFVAHRPRVDPAALRADPSGPPAPVADEPAALADEPASLASAPAAAPASMTAEASASASPVMLATAAAARPLPPRLRSPSPSPSPSGEAQTAPRGTGTETPNRALTDRK